MFTELDLETQKNPLPYQVYLDNVNETIILLGEGSSFTLEDLEADKDNTYEYMDTVFALNMEEALDILYMRKADINIIPEMDCPTVYMTWDEWF